MRYFTGVALVAVGCLLWAGEGRGYAQGMVPRPGFGGPPVTSTPYSPYLNLLRPGSFMQNYWGLVQPELQWRNSVQTLGQQVQANAQAISGLQGAQGPPTTGHRVRFMDTGGYFPGSGRGGRSGR
jgi:hypothetical protein